MLLEEDLLYNFCTSNLIRGLPCMIGPSTRFEEGKRHVEDTRRSHHRFLPYDRRICASLKMFSLHFNASRRPLRHWNTWQRSCSYSSGAFKRRRGPSGTGKEWEWAQWASRLAWLGKAWEGIARRQSNLPTEQKQQAPLGEAARSGR